MCVVIALSAVVSVPEWAKGVDSSSTVFALVGSNPTADSYAPTTLLYLLLSKGETAAFQHWPAPGEAASTTNTEFFSTTSTSCARMPKTDRQYSGKCN